MGLANEDCFKRLSIDADLAATGDRDGTESPKVVENHQLKLHNVLYVTSIVGRGANGFCFAFALKFPSRGCPIDQSVRARGEEEPEEFSPLPEPTARVDLWRHEQIVKEFIPGLIESAGLERTRSISRFTRFRGVVVSAPSEI